MNKTFMNKSIVKRKQSCFSIMYNAVVCPFPFAKAPKRTMPLYGIVSISLPTVSRNGKIYDDGEQLGRGHSNVARL